MIEKLTVLSEQEIKQALREYVAKHYETVSSPEQVGVALQARSSWLFGGRAKFSAPIEVRR